MTLQHHASCMNLKEELLKAGVPHDWNHGRNESLVHRARMEMTAAFLASEHTHLMWLDADIEYEAGEIAKLWNLGADIAVGAYSMKRPDRPLSAWKDGKLVRLEDCPKEPFEVDCAGTGFFMVKREVLEAVAQHLVAWETKAATLIDRLSGIVTVDELATLKRMQSGVAASYAGPDGRVPALWMTPIWADGLESEDYHFCRIAREAGFQVIMDPSVRLTHWGQFGYGA